MATPVPSCSTASPLRRRSEHREPTRAGGRPRPGSLADAARPADRAAGGPADVRRVGDTGSLVVQPFGHRGRAELAGFRSLVHAGAGAGRGDRLAVLRHVRAAGTPRAVAAP